MQLESLKIFCDVVRWSSFSRGASENGISQSSASQAVHQLEVRLGVKLIDRSKRPLVVTPQGRVYYDGCRELVERYVELEERVKAPDQQDRVTGTVAVAAIYSVGLHHMSQYVRSFEERNPGANVRLEYLHPSRVVDRVTAGEAELGLVSFPRKWPELNVIPWREESMILTVPPSHRFAGRASVRVSELRGEPFVALDHDLAIRRAIDRFLRHHDAQVDVVLEFDNIENIKRAVEIGSGVSILPEPTSSRELEAGSLVAVELEVDDVADRLVRPLAIIHRRNASLDLAGARFLELLKTMDVVLKKEVGAAHGAALADANRRIPAGIAP
jgi:DNA-binding transcriptional LysR family regulator